MPLNIWQVLMIIYMHVYKNKATPCHIFSCSCLHLPHALANILATPFFPYLFTFNFYMYCNLTYMYMLKECFF